VDAVLLFAWQLARLRGDAASEEMKLLTDHASKLSPARAIELMYAKQGNFSDRLVRTRASVPSRRHGLGRKQQTTDEMEEAAEMDTVPEAVKAGVQMPWAVAKSLVVLKRQVHRSSPIGPDTANATPAMQADAMQGSMGDDVAGASEVSFNSDVSSRFDFDTFKDDEATEEFDDPLDELARRFADLIERRVDDRCRFDVGLGFGGRLPPLSDRAAFDELLGPTLLCCGKEPAFCRTELALQATDGVHVAVLFGTLNTKGTNECLTNLREALRQHQGKLHVVYASNCAGLAADKKFDFDSHTRLEWPVGMWAIPFQARDQFVMRLGKHFEIIGTPTLVVLQWHATERRAVVVNADATLEVLEKRVDRFPWPRRTTVELLGERMLAPLGAKRVVATNDVLCVCTLLILYFDGGRARAAAFELRAI
jgi:hypothetical protein